MPLIHEPSLFTLLILSAFGMLPSMSILSPLYPYLLWPVSSPSDASKTMPILTVATYLAPAAPAFSFLISLLVAPLIGSFLGVLIYRIPRSLPIGMARSRCDTCKTSLKPINLLPIFSYIFQRGRCARCSAPIGRFHVTVELAAVLVPSSLAVAAFLQSVYYPDVFFWADCILGWVLLALAWIDTHSLRLPDIFTLPLILTGLALSLLDAATVLTPTLTDRVVGVVLGWAAFTLLDLVYRAIRKRRGLGGGDAKLFAAGGAWLGAEALPSIALIAAIIGLTAALATSLCGKPLSTRTRLPFGPCLAMAIWLCVLGGA
ncbi:A24 family peptidase [Gluconobacter sp. P5B12]|uniref:prepilin peptidase n=1 Tax=Gluconobacter sp. P5B12 TaxID=2762618 RepID=UPI0027D23CFA|nr:A24 family peptidase [Gluconobacter sp. P5B12]